MNVFLQGFVFFLSSVCFIYALYLMICGILGIPLTEGARRQKEDSDVL